MIRRAPLCLLALAFAAPAVRADPVYVIEQLVVGVTSERGAEGGERVAQVKSADKLELIERQGDEAHVRLSNGTEGWIKGSYLTTDAPLQTRLTERSAEVEKLKQDGDKQKQETEKLRQEAGQLKQDVSRLESELAAARTLPKVAAATSGEPPPPAPVHETVFLSSPGWTGQTSWQFLVGSGAVMLLVGFVIGWKTLDRRIRQKYGGLRIY